MINLIALCLNWGFGVPVCLFAFPNNPKTVRYCTAAACFTTGLINLPFVIHWFVLFMRG